ncbi:MAG: cyclic nucleotide-binding domain-containing protein, partial [Myxococcota bacterium]
MSQDKPRASSSDHRIALDGMSGGPKLASHVKPGLDNNETIVNFFTSVPLFSLLDADEVAQMLRICTIETAAPGEVLFAEGEAAKSMLILEHGEVTVTKHNRGGLVQIANLGDGSVIGEMALIAGAPRSATVKAVAETRFYRLDGRHFDALRRQ